jgi:hypothetical protein
VLLGASGLDAIGVEVDSKRAATAQAVLEESRRALGEAAPGEALSCKIVHGRFPDAFADRDTSQSLAVLSNVTTALKPAERRAFIAGLLPFRQVVIDVQRFIERRQSEDETKALIAELVGAGLADPRVVLDLGARGHYVAFDGRPVDGIIDSAA